MEIKTKNNWLTSHLDTIILLGALASGFLWMNAKFNTIEMDVNTIKTVLIVKKIMPCELAKSENLKKEQASGS